jgi:hypothetical protein
MLRKHVSPSMAVALIALFVALSGGAYAALTLPRNSVGAAQLKRGSVTASKVRNGTLTKADFKRGTLLKGATGARGAAGPAGSAGTPGATGARGPSAFDPLPSGASIQGAFALDTYTPNAAQTMFGQVTYPATLPAVPAFGVGATDPNGTDVSALAQSGKVDAACSGDAANPTAPPGKLCFYLGASRANLKPGTLDARAIYTNKPSSTLSLHAFSVVVDSLAAGAVVLDGAWAYTAP